MDVEAVLRAMTLDKKTSGGTIRWVLLESIGNATTRTDVPPDLVEQALRRLAE
jgi:3-dehydroquinate synthetase